MQRNESMAHIEKKLIEIDIALLDKNFKWIRDNKKSGEHSFNK